MSTSVITRPLSTSSTGHGESVLHDYAADRIRKMLPHRAPMLLLDRAYDVEPGVCGYGIKAVSVNEPYFAGHYPDEPIMPGVLRRGHGPAGSRHLRLRASRERS